jgi:hypothetical protein
MESLLSSLAVPSEEEGSSDSEAPSDSSQTSVDAADANHADGVASSSSSQSSADSAADADQTDSGKASSDSSHDDSLSNHARRRLRTEKARQAYYKMICQRKARQIISQALMDPTSTVRSYSQEVQKSCFASSSDLKKHSCPNPNWLQRGVVAFLQASSRSLKDLLLKFCTPQSHIITFNVMDDCSIRLGDRQRNSSSVQTVCNNYQRVLVHDNASQHVVTARIHEPMIIIPSGSARDLHAYWSPWLLLSAFGIGARLVCCNLENTDIRAKLRCQVLMTDGLKTNSAVFNIQVRESLRWTCLI